MSTTDTRPGFRLPWTTDHRAATTEAASEADATEAQAGAVAPEDASDTTPPETTGTANHDSPEDPVTPTLAAPSAPVTTRFDAPATGSSEAAPAAESPAPVTWWPRPVEAAEEAVAARPRPTKFLADLTRAMQAAAETERAQTMTQFQAEATAFIEGFRVDAAGRAALYRTQADEDVAGIRDWSKAEVARIKEETDRRISGRKGELEAELARHADRIDRAVQAIERRVDGYGAEMARFFERLLALEDPAEFAAAAASLPEPPSLAVDLAADEVATVDAIEATADTTPDTTPDQPGEPGEPAAGTTAEPIEASDDVVGVVDEPEATTTAEAVAPEAAAPEPAMDDDTVAPEPAMDEAPTPVDVDPAPIATYRRAIDGAASSHPWSQAHGFAAEPVDPRLAALGLTPDFEAAEVEAAVELRSAGDGSDDDDGIETLGDSALAARIAGLIPGATPSGRAATEPAPAAPASPAESTATRIVVVGLVSVASIAGFKRLLSRAPGVQSVSVSSGPDGEFIFTTAHGTEVSIGETVATLPGFDARVTGSVDGVVEVTAHDPEAEG